MILTDYPVSTELPIHLQAGFEILEHGGLRPSRLSNTKSTIL